MQHNGDYPTLIQMWGNLTTETRVDGSLSDGSCYLLGPYLQQPPVNFFENSSTLGAAAAGVGWTYDPVTGAVTAVMEAAKAAEVFPAGVPRWDITTY